MTCWACSHPSTAPIIPGISHALLHVDEGERVLDRRRDGDLVGAARVHGNGLTQRDVVSDEPGIVRSTVVASVDCVGEMGLADIVLDNRYAPLMKPPTTMMGDQDERRSEPRPSSWSCRCSSRPGGG
jgi:hypothetical protein